MIAAVLNAVLRFRYLVWSVVILLVVLSVWAIRTAPLDAIPDISDPQVVVYVKWQRSPQLRRTRRIRPMAQGSPA